MNATNYTIDFNSNGTCVVQDNGVNYDGTYECDGNSGKLKVSGILGSVEVYPFTMEGENIVLVRNGYDFVFEPYNTWIAERGAERTSDEADDIDSDAVVGFDERGDDYDESSEYDEDGDEHDEEDDDDSDARQDLTYEEAKEIASNDSDTALFIKRDDLYSALDAFGVWGTQVDSFTGYDPLIITYDGKDLADVPVVDIKAGDQIVMLAERDYYFWPVKETGECFYYDGVAAGWGLDHRFVELDGKPLTKDGPEDEEILASKGAHYLEGQNGSLCRSYVAGPEGTSFVGTTKEGVDFVDETITIDEPYLTFDANSLEPKVVETRNGYFILDVSSFKPGLYAGSVSGFNVLDAAPDFLLRIM